jgi:DNA-binding transcriptional ArsR family regulator
MPAQEQESAPVVRFDSSRSCPELYSFIQSIDKVKVLELPRGFNKPPIRSAIMKVLREGIEDESTKQRRYALNAREIKQELDKNKNLINKLGQEKAQKRRKKKPPSEISYTNLYFHLNKLQEAGAIHTVVIAIERSHRIAYYGRTAQVILIRELEAQLSRYEEIFGEFSKFTKFLKPDIDVEEIKKIPEQYYKLRNERELIIAHWVADHAQIIRDENLDITSIFSALKIIDTINPKYKPLLGKLADFLPNS